MRGGREEPLTRPQGLEGPRLPLERTSFEDPLREFTSRARPGCWLPGPSPGPSSIVIRLMAPESLKPGGSRSRSFSKGPKSLSLHSPHRENAFKKKTREPTYAHGFSEDSGRFSGCRADLLLAWPFGGPFRARPAELRSRVPPEVSRERQVQQSDPRASPSHGAGAAAHSEQALLRLPVM